VRDPWTRVGPARSGLTGTFFRPCSAAFIGGSSANRKLSQRNAAPAFCLPVVDVIVRREKALDFSGCNSRPGTGSLHPVAIEAAVEATKLSELSM
jgi:hypothetical protein